MRVADMLDPDLGIVAVRWEGSQDVDFKIEDGREVYAQVKNEQGKKLTLTGLGDVLTSFALDLLDSGNQPLRFLYVANAGTLDRAAQRLRNRASSEKDRKAVAALLRKENEFGEMLQSELESLVAILVDRIDFQVPSGHEQDGVSAYEALAYRRLSRYGIPSEGIQALIDKLARDLDTPGEMTREQLLNVVAPSLKAAGSFSKLMTQAAAMQPGLAFDFIFRSRVTQSVSDLLFGPEESNVKLCGLGGSGKTQLATGIANDARCSVRYPDGVLW